MKVQTPDERPELLAKLFTEEIFGAQRSYVEAITGPAVLVDSDTREYKLGECRVAFSYSGDEVSSITLRNVSSHCGFSWAAVAPNYGSLPSPETMRFGDAMKGDGGASLAADCLDSCGTGTGEHYFESRFGGSHADGWRQIVLRANVANKITESIVVALRRAKGDDVSLSGLCDDDLRPFAALLASLPVDEITIGTVEDNCEAGVGEVTSGAPPQIGLDGLPIQDPPVTESEPAR